MDLLIKGVEYLPKIWTGIKYLGGGLLAWATGTEIAKVHKNVKNKTNKIASEETLKKAAIKARDNAVAQAKGLSSKKRDDITTIVAGYNKSTGMIAIGINSTSIYHGKLCTEDLVVLQLGGTKLIGSIKMTPAIRPRTGKIIPVCKRCQKKYPRASFIKGTLFL